MKRNYKEIIESIKSIGLANPFVNSVDDGRELELDVTKYNLFPRLFVRTDAAPINAGLGSVELGFTLTLVVVDRVETDRSNNIDVLNTTHIILSDVLAMLHRENIIRIEEPLDLQPIYDAHDSQLAGWSVSVNAFIDSGFSCYPLSAPVLQSLVIPADGNSIVLTYDTLLNESIVPDVSSFSISGGSGVVVDSVTINGAVVTIEITSGPFIIGDTATLYYDQGANSFQDDYGNLCAAFAEAVTNNSEVA